MSQKRDVTERKYASFSMLILKHNVVRMKRKLSNFVSLLTKIEKEYQILFDLTTFRRKSGQLL